MIHRFKQYIYLLGATLMAGMLVCLPSCQSDTSLPGENGIEIRLQLPPALTLQTRSGVLDEITISNVWVVQYVTGSTQVIKCQYFDGNSISNSTSYLLQVTTSQFVNATSRFYVIANAGSNFLYTDFQGTEAELKAKTFAIGAGTGDQPTFLASDAITYTPESSSGSNDKAVIVAPLQRAYAKISVQWQPKNIQGSMTFISVTAYNLPKNMAVYPRAGGDLQTAYPVVSTDNILADATGIGTGNLAQGSTRIFYMAENLRGMGSGSSFPEKNLTGKGPGTNGSLEGCTYIVLSGEYIYPGATSPIKVEYKIYLGGNLMNDYNIQRGTLYNITLYVSGANSADVRVTITDGNVIVFDEVETVENSVTF